LRPFLLISVVVASPGHYRASGSLRLAPRMIAILGMAAALVRGRTDRRLLVLVTTRATIATVYV
jgi:hypothetical protein